MSPYVRAVGVSRNQSAEQLVATCEGIIKGLTDNPAYPNPPIDLKTLQAAVDDLCAALAAQAHGGMAATAEKKNRQANLISIMRKLKHYVEDNGGNDIAVLLSSFLSAASTRHRSPIANPSILGIDRGNSDELMLKVTPIVRAKCYEVRSAVVGNGNVAGAWQQAGLFTSSHITVANLVPTTTYVFQVRAVGAAGNTEWSKPVSHMCAESRPELRLAHPSFYCEGEALGVRWLDAAFSAQR
jgi:hypothetical protein